MHKNQGIVYTNQARFKVLVAGRRFGKTILALISLLTQALSQQESLKWYLSPSYRQSKMIAWRLLKKLVTPSIKADFNESELSLYLPHNGSIIELKGADNEDSLRGPGLGSKYAKGSLGIAIDEFATIYNNWAVWNEVIRPMLTDNKAGALFIGTPKGKDALFELFLRGQRDEPGWQSWQFKTVDNPYIDPEEVAEAKRAMPERYFRQEYEASFEDYVGLIWPEFTRDHIIKPHYVQQAYNLVGAIDPAVTGTTAALKAAIDEEGNLIVYDELYEANKRVSEACEAIQESDVYWLIDPSSKAKHREKEGDLYSLYDEYRDNGIVAYPAENDVDAGINRVGEYFKQGKIKIFSSCTNLIRELERYHWAELKQAITGEQRAKPYKKDDHLCDCLRYIIMSRPSETELNYVPELSLTSPLYKMQQLRKKRKEFER